MNCSASISKINPHVVTLTFYNSIRQLFYDILHFEIKRKMIFQSPDTSTFTLTDDKLIFSLYRQEAHL